MNLRIGDNYVIVGARKGDTAFKELAKEYRHLQKNLQEVKDFALELQTKNRELMIENEKLKITTNL